ncbi:alpha/beta hydrolase family protein [Pseudonocardia phyllosphaerae]|uniref:alpha/beta hydrolase family protein n=1 Tax=Pseudonocardia phyllosphaerae TaxID=3390502 RepID=UPI00397A1B55
MGDPGHVRPLSRRAFGALALGGVAAGLAGCSSSKAPARADRGPAVERIGYGGRPDQWGEISFPRDRPLPKATVIVLHGGFWRRGAGGPEQMRPMASKLVEAGYATWNVQYRTVGGEGGWPSTFDDVAMAADHLASMHSTRIDLKRLIVVGHSAGGQLAAWLAMRPKIPAGQPGANPTVRPAGVVSLAGVLDLEAAVDLGDDAVVNVVGATPDADPERYRITSPIEALPLGVRTICVHGTADQVVPISQSERFVDDAVEAGDRAELVRVEGADHNALIDVRAPAWKQVSAAVNTLAA